MKTLLISFQPYWFNQIKTGEKIYEYRTAFPKETVAAYMYVTKPVQAIIGYAVFSARIPLSDWAEQYQNKPEILKRIHEYMTHRKYVAEIRSFSSIEPIPLKDINDCVEKFVIPQSYYYLDNFPELFEYIKKKTTFLEHTEIKNEFTDIDESKICSLRRD